LSALSNHYFHSIPPPNRFSDSDFRIYSYTKSKLNSSLYNMNKFNLKYNSLLNYKIKK
jgi:hypothetical protein